MWARGFQQEIARPTKQLPFFQFLTLRYGPYSFWRGDGECEHQFQQKLTLSCTYQGKESQFQFNGDEVSLAQGSSNVIRKSDISELRIKFSDHKIIVIFDQSPYEIEFGEWEFSEAVSAIAQRMKWID